jgi:hypothetical protein
MVATGQEPVREILSRIQVEDGHRTQLQGFVDENTAARLLGRPVATLRRWRNERRYVRYYKQGALVRYKLSELEEFVSNGAVEVTA